MTLITALDFTLPLTNPVIIFSLVLFIILFAPILLNRIKIPHIIGLIIAGVIVGPYGFNLLLRDSSIVLFGTVGLLYIMFLAGLEIDLVEFNKNKFRSLLFGLFTFCLPMILGTIGGYYILGYSMTTSILFASMMASHTLLAYPIASRYGINTDPSVTITIGGTMITDILALLVLAVIVGMSQGEIGSSFWLNLSISMIVFAFIIIFIFPLIARWFFKHYEDSIGQYIFVLAMVFLGGFLAEAAGIEAIVGAFITGLALNKFIPHNSALMNRIGFVGNAIFIPFFLVGVGMLVNVKVLFSSLGGLKVGAVMIAVVILGKIGAAWFTQKSFKLSKDQRRMIGGLSMAQAAATLATVLVGYNVILGEAPDGTPIRLLNEDILNGSILTILVTCTVSSLIVEKASKRIADAELTANTEESTEDKDKVLICFDEPDTVSDLVDLALMMNTRKEAPERFALHVVEEQNDDESKRKESEKMMKTALEQAAGSDTVITPIIRYDQSVSKGILFTIKEHLITDIIIGVTQSGSKKSQIGITTDQILGHTEQTVFVHHSVQPFNTLARIVVVVNKHAEWEEGFNHWVSKVLTISKESGLPLTIYCNSTIKDTLESINHASAKPLTINFENWEDWDDFLILSRELQPNDLFIVVISRPGYSSYHAKLAKTSYYLNKYFAKFSYILLYPQQKITYSKLTDLHHEEGTILDVFTEGRKVAEKTSNLIGNLFRKDGAKQEDNQPKDSDK
ncbi:Kef-type K+ transport system, membrane component KefB [Arachidicoccus rhizosphaerae]|uniref:Kef-type K+ transport system, membrane component KefB n=1 Tax=Arachidicoccus rhizosphaerae TaxID=551991 RepID=A0A1H3YW87_9BACT|nr:cation:proton antiporter [Arachidicoccus rhizosphaerae]SEA15766.1 Kef-type K+ transport system, membrane component KefB [Arachidicoccus rhizosphaerae]